jgi:uncharacterized protein YdiU (UPF0061 family)
MTTSVRSLFSFDNTFVRDLVGLYEPSRAHPVPQPQLLALNEEVAEELGLDAEALGSPDGVAVLVGNTMPEGAASVAQAYAGHQFGGYSPRLGDGRALLVGEILDGQGHRRDLHLKGSGRTAFTRGGDGKAAVGPMLRELVIGEAMHALGIPTTRALAVVATGETIAREQPLPGAVLARVAQSHLRVGTFQYAAALDDPTVLRRLADYAIERHHPGAADADNAYLGLLQAVVDAQATLVAQWMLVGFVHGVMNTDNMTISGETIDYGPCAFIDAFDPAAVFSSIDHRGRYAFAQQPPIAQWNLTRLAETLLPLLADKADDNLEDAAAAATAVLQSFADRYHQAWNRGRRDKLGLAVERPEDIEIADAFLALLHTHAVDHTSAYRSLSSAVRGDDTSARALFADHTAFDAWATTWRARLDQDRRDPRAVATAMDRVNPVYIPRNHLVEAALADATAGDLASLGRLLAVVAQPFGERPGLEAYAQPAPPSFGRYRTFCGT